ncbi:hypothetical protein BDR07DRAFT_1457187 [Suillus spraguei]|nr:hypothetical protein BDR07DRAFT_1457187 [Suillus spraguei]
MFISWLGHIIKIVAFRSYRSILSVLLRLIRYYKSIVIWKEEGFRERPGGLALSSQPRINQPNSQLTPPASLAVPLLEVPLQSLHSRQSQPQLDIRNLQVPTPGLHGGPNDADFNADSPPNSSMLSRPSPASEYSILEVGIATPPPLVVPGRTFDITLTPITPRQVNRYQRNVRVKDEYEAFLVKKGPLDCSEELASIAGWEPLTQPEEALMFYQPYKRVFTDANVRHHETRIKIDQAVEKAYQEVRNEDILLKPFVELGLELIVEDGEEMWGYYFVDHKRRVIFWFEDHRSRFLINHMRGVERTGHVKHALESQYWRHIELFPNKRSLPEDVAVELKELVTYAQADSITSSTSLTRFTSDQIASILNFVDLLTSSTNREREHSVWITARFMRLFYRDIIEARWKQYIDRLNSDWNGYTIYSTVMLAVDISFLSVSSVQTQKPAILLCYISTLCAMGSLVVTLLFVGQVSKSLRGSGEAMVSLLVGTMGSVLGLESFPLMLSFPFGLLIWGSLFNRIAFFAASLSVVIFRTSGVMILVIYPIWAATFILTTWPVLATNHHPHIGSSTKQLVVYLWFRLYMWYWITGLNMSLAYGTGS